ncbi:MAG: hypothetical protein M3444_18075 [Acidobacteriota bacterium]|nr:hypothetical protein [Acidobacteriota bacterium]MDQ5835677.1 hypothetical protein [Acidobacteriota bacterium]
MSQKPIAIIGSVDPKRSDYKPPIKNATAAPGAARALGKELARAKHRILVFSSNPVFIENGIVTGYVEGCIESGQAPPKSIVVLYPRERDPDVHGEFDEQKTHSTLFDPKTDPHPWWEASYYQSLPDVEGILVLGGGRASLIMGLMALASRMPVVSLACFGGNGEELWAMSKGKPWIDPDDHDEMGRNPWNDGMAKTLIESFGRQRANLDRLAREQGAAAVLAKRDRERRSLLATAFGISAAVLTAAGVFGHQLLDWGRGWLVVYALCFIAVPISAGIAGSMFFTLRQRRNQGNNPPLPSARETAAHGLWAGLGSATLFFVSQVTANRDIKSLSQAVVEGTGGLDVLLLFSLMIGFVAGLTYEAVFGKWEAVDASRVGMIERAGD